MEQWGPCLSHDHVAVHIAVDVGVALDPHQAVLLGVIQPVPRAPRADQPLQLVHLHFDTDLDFHISRDRKPTASQTTTCHPCA